MGYHIARRDESGNCRQVIIHPPSLEQEMSGRICSPQLKLIRTAKIDVSILVMEEKKLVPSVWSLPSLMSDHD